MYRTMEPKWMRELTVLALLCIAIWCVPQASSETVRIGASEWMSSERGDVIEDKYKIFVASTAAQYALAAKHFNERNTTIIPDLQKLAACPHQISIVRVCDDGGEKLKGANDAYEFFTVDSVHALGGYSDTLVSETVSILMETMGQIPVLSNWAQGNSLSDKVTYPNFARTWPSDVQYLAALDALIKQLNYQRVAILHLSDDSGTALAQALSVSLGAADIQTLRFAFTSYDGESLGNAVNMLAQSKSNVIVCLIYTDDLIDYLADSAVANDLVTSQLWIFSYMDVNPTKAQFQENVNLTKLMFGSLRLQHTRLFNNNDLDLFSAYLEKIWLTFGETELTLINDSLPPHGSGDQRICSNSNLQGKVNSTFFQDALEFGRDVNNWPETYDMVLALGFAACSNYTQMPTGPDLYTSLLAVDFVGLTGRVRFDENGDRAADALTFKLFNWVMDGEIAALAPFNIFRNESTNEFVFPNNVQFRGGQGLEFLPVDIVVPYHEKNQLGNLVILGYMELGLLNILSITSLIWVTYHRKSKIIFNSQPELMVLAIVGCVIASWALLALSMEDTGNLSSIDLDRSCHAAPVLFCLGFQVAFIALIAKTMRIAFIFNNKKLKKKRYVTLVRVVSLVFLVIVIETVCWAAWTVLSPLKFSRVIRFSDINGYPLDSAGQCIASGAVSENFLIIVFLLHAFMMLGCAYAANKVKNAPSEFHDARYIALAVAFLTQAYLIAVPVTIAIYSQPVGRYIVLTTMVFMSSGTLLAATVFPKMYLYFTGYELFSFTGSPSLPGDHAVVAASPAQHNNSSAVKQNSSGAKGFRETTENQYPAYSSQFPVQE